MRNVDTNIKHIELYKLFENTIPYDELINFNNFLKLIGAYDEFYKLSDISSVQESINKFNADMVYNEIFIFALRDHFSIYWLIVSHLNNIRARILYGESYLSNQWRYGSKEFKPDKNIINKIRSVRIILEGVEEREIGDKYEPLEKFINHIDVNHLME